MYRKGIGTQGLFARMAATVTAVLAMVLLASPAQAWPQTEFSRDIARQQKEILTPELKEQGFRWGDKAFIRVFKAESELELWLKKGGKYKLFKTYPICKWSGQLGPKLKEGDEQAPEGFYYISKNRLNPWSAFHLSMNMGYPNRYDRAHGRTGSALMVHGLCVSLGCYAMTNDQIEEIYSLVEASLKKHGSVVRIHSFPFRMTDDNMQNFGGGEWDSFWKNLKTGYDWFERRKVPPNVTVSNKQYRFGNGS